MAERKIKIEDKDAARLTRLFEERDAATKQFNAAKNQMAIARLKISNVNAAIDTIAQDYMEEGDARTEYNLDTNELTLVTPDPEEENKDAGDGKD